MLFLFVFLLNVLAFVLFGADKYRAKKKLFRISEDVLLTVCFLGGGIGGYLGMRVFRHKTNKIQFQFLIPASVIVSVVLYIVAFWMVYKS